MQGIGTLHQVANPFWQVAPGQDVERNPLRYYCAPNQVTPDYVSSPAIRDFIAYGFVCCWDSLSPQFFTMWNMVQHDDLQWFRHHFLTVLENLILAYYKGEVEIGFDQFDHDWAEELFIGNSDEGDTEAICYTWMPACIHDDTLALVLSITDCTGQTVPGDDEVIWVELEALKDRAAVKFALEQAFLVNKMGHTNETAWAEVLSDTEVET